MFGEKMPYTNFHDLNLDWILKTVRDFEDHYSEISEAIEDGKSQLEEKTTIEEGKIEAKSDAEQENISEHADDEKDAISDLAEQYITQIQSLGARGKRIIVIGDSYADRTNAGGYNYFQLMKGYLGFSDSDAYFTHVSGGCFAHAQTDHTFLYLLQNLSVTNPETITDIYVQCGANDVGHSYASNMAALQTFAQYVKQYYPIARYHIFACGLTMKPTEIADRRTNALQAFNDASIYGFDYILNSNSVLMDTYYLESDRCHPNNSGVLWIAWRLCNAITSGVCQNHYIISDSNLYQDLAILGEGATITLVDHHVYMTLDNDNININSNSQQPLLAFRLSGITSLTVGNWIRIELKNTLTCGYFENSPVCSGFIVDSNGDWFMLIHGQITYSSDDNKYYLYFRPRQDKLLPTANHVYQLFMNMSFTQ